MKLKELIEDKLLISERQFAKEIGITRATINNIKKGKVKPSELTVKKICHYFGVDWHEYVE